jgi:hypothetical protein
MEGSTLTFAHARWQGQRSGSALDAIFEIGRGELIAEHPTLLDFDLPGEHSHFAPRTAS